jgi:hypothetical protein
MTSENLGRQLYDRGWRQGTPLNGSAVQTVLNSFEPRDLSEFESDGSGLVLTTQECDLVKPEIKVPALEVIAHIVDADRARSIKANDSRFFVMDSASGLIADRARKYAITRDALNQFPAPDGPPFGGDTRQSRRFARWLASGYDRPALPDEVHGELAVPLLRSLSTAVRAGAPHEWLNDQLDEVRLAGNFSAPPPWPVDLFFILSDDADKDRCEEAIGEVLAESGLMGTKADACVRLDEWWTSTLALTSALDYLSSSPLSMDELSVSG